MIRACIRVHVIIILVLLAACATLPRASSQAMVAAETAYQASADAMLSYVSRPDADPGRKATVQRLNEGAYASLLAARAAYRAGRAPDVAAVESASEQVKAAVPVEGAK